MFPDLTRICKIQELYFLIPNFCVRIVKPVYDFKLGTGNREQGICILKPLNDHVANMLYERDDDNDDENTIGNCECK